ncbi:MAG: hypothetical protein V4655_12305 [Bdellovibrionota bacterium]
MKARLTLLISIVVFNCLSCSGESELDKAIDEAMLDNASDQSIEDSVSIRYYSEYNAR